MARHLRLPADLAALVDDAHGRLFDRDIQTGIVPHAAFLLLMFVAAPKRRPRLPSARSAAPHLESEGHRPAEYPIFKMNSPATKRVGNGGWPAPDAHTPANRLSRKPPIDLARQPHQRMTEVDDLLQR